MRQCGRAGLVPEAFGIGRLFQMSVLAWGCNKKLPAAYSSRKFSVTIEIVAVINPFLGVSGPAILRALMPSRDRSTAGWSDGDLPGNVQLGDGSRISGPDAFKRFFSTRDVALSLGDRSRTDGVKFAIGPKGYVAIGHDCYLNDCILLAEQEIRIGNYVMIGWNTTVSDSDFHPIAPAERIADAIALSPHAEDRARPKALCQSVLIGDNVFIGPACTILKGVTIGDGAYVEAGSVITHSIPANAQVRGNPAIIVSDDVTK